MRYINLRREVDNRIRYLKLHISKTLLSDTFIVEKEFGNINNIKPTGTIRKFFISLDDANIYLKK